MDEVQTMLQRMGDDDGDATAAPPARPQRTKLVFLYSDEDEAGADAPTATSDTTTTTSSRMCAVDSASLALQVSDGDLAELQAEAAQQASHDASAADVTPPPLPPPLAPMPLPFAVDTTPTLASSSSSSSRMRAVCVPAEGLAVQPRPRWRRYLTVQEVTQTPLPRHVRFAATAADDDNDDEEATARACRGGDTTGDDDDSGGEALQPVVSADGVVRAVTSSGGYCLTVDESDLLDADAGDACDDVMAANDDNENDNNDDNNEADDDNDDDDDDDDDEAEEALDEALVVAVAEQLLRCCTSDELDPAIAREATRFAGVAAPLLQQLYDKQLDAHAFGERIDADLRRFTRVYRSVYRPRDAPVVIDGVVMDF